MRPCTISSRGFSILRRGTNSSRSFLPVAEEIARLGAINSLSQALLKLTRPGVPDIYQGNEIWDFSLVDPDNRRPVDYAKRKKMLEALAGATPEELLGNWTDGRIKLFLTHRLLVFRREHAELFRSGTYLPLGLAGEFADCCIAFAREFEGQRIVVLAPRLSSRVGFPPIGRGVARHGGAVAGRSGVKGVICSPEKVGPRKRARFASPRRLARLPFAVLRNSGFQPDP